MLGVPAQAAWAVSGLLAPSALECLGRVPRPLLTEPNPSKKGGVGNQKRKQSVPP